MTRRLSRMFLGCMLMLFLVAGISPASAAENAKPQLKKVSPVTSGAVLKEYDWPEKDVKVYVIENDLGNPYIKLDVIPGGGKLTQRLNVSKMAENTGAVAAINADFYNMYAEGVPIGPTVISKRWVTSPPIMEGIYALGVTSAGEACIERYFFDGHVMAPNGEYYELSGLNRTYYWEEPSGEHSHVNKLHLYNDMWGGRTRANDGYTTPTEMLVKDGKVVDIKEGSYFDFAVPEGHKILRGHRNAAEFLVENFGPGDSVEIDYFVEPNRDWSMVVGGHALLVENGRSVSYGRDASQFDGLRARTAAGISEDGKTLYLIGVEGRTENSKGLRLGDLSQFLEDIGVWKALNLDGGGSTTMVSRPFGDFDTKRVFSPEQTHERLVVNAIGLYSTAPDGDLEGFILSGEEFLLSGEEADYDLKAYDQYYNPVDPAEHPVDWEFPDNLERSREGVFKAIGPGSGEISVSLGDAFSSIPVLVASKSDLASFSLKSNVEQVLTGEKVPFELELKTVQGLTREVPAALVNWQFYGLVGTIKNNMIEIKDFGAGDTGFVVARYDGFSAPIPLVFGEEKPLLSFSDLDNISFSAYPSEIDGELTLVDDPVQENKKVARLDYDFRGGQGTTAAYIELGDADIKLDSKPEGLLVDVYGREGKQWIRMEVEDSEGELRRVDLTTSVDWSGWRTLPIDLGDISYPVDLKRIYVVDLDAGEGDRAASDNLLFKDLRIKATTEVEEPQSLRMGLEADNPIYIVNEEEGEMDVPPQIINGRTMVPVRFVSNAFNADILWDNENKNATVIKDESWIDLWPGEDRMVVDGVASGLDVSPMLLQGRTMLPLRAVGEALDLTVHWDSSTGRITLYN